MGTVSRLCQIVASGSSEKIQPDSRAERNIATIPTGRTKLPMVLVSAPASKPVYAWTVSLRRDKGYTKMP